MSGDKKIAVIITSVIKYSKRQLSYSNTRSIFSPEERLEQTKRTIKSIKEKIPDAKIILCEQGTDKKITLVLKDYVDYYEYIGNKTLVRLATDSLFKGLGEALGLIYTIKYIPPDAEQIFKISGRYYLNENFNLNNWKNGDFIIKKNDSIMSTRLYSFKKNVLNVWKKSLFLSIPLLLLNMSIEKTQLFFMPKNKIREVNALGVSGLIGINGEIIKE